MPARARDALLALAMLALGVLVGRALLPAGAPSEGRAQLSEAAHDLTVLRDEVAALRSLLSRDHGRVPALGASPAPSEQKEAAPAPATAELQPDPVVSAAAEEAADELDGVIARATEQGRWTSRDRDDFRRLSPHADGERMEALMGELMTALNQGRIVPGTDGPPF